MTPQPLAPSAALAALLALPTALDAQGRSEPVPRELVAMLVGAPPPEIVVGELPPGIPDGVPLPPGRPVGGLERSWATTVVVEVEGSPEAALAAYDEALAAAGFERPVYRPMTEGGFQGNSLPGRSGWCAGGVHVDASSRALEEGAYVRVDLRDRGSGTCERDRGFERTRGRDLLPVLRPVAGARVRPAGGGGSDDHRESQAVIETLRPAREIAAAYAAQLEATGWMPEGETEGARTATRRWTLTVPDGEPWTGFLAVWEVGDGRMVASLRVDRVRGG